MTAVTDDVHLDNARLVARAISGEQAAFRMLFERYSPLVYRIIYRMLAVPEDAADLTQDVFVRAYQRLFTLKDGQAFQAWITRLAVNMAHDYLRRSRPRPLSLDAPLDANMREIADPGDDQSTRVLRGELHDEVQRALLALAPDYRIVVVLHHLEEMPVEAIAQLLRIPTGTVKSRLSRGRAELKRRLGDYLE